MLTPVFFGVNGSFYSGGVEINLREILQWQAKIPAKGEIPAEVLWSNQWYASTFIWVIGWYKLAATKREMKDGANVNPESLDMFQQFALRGEMEGAMLAAANRDWVPAAIAALVWHDAASGWASHNGGQPRRQMRLNRKALRLLEQVPESERDDDWACVWEKVTVGLNESPMGKFDPRLQLRIIASMSGRSKDEAGRREFLARHYLVQHQVDEAIFILTPVENDSTSDPTQKQRALTLLHQLQGKQPA